MSQRALSNPELPKRALSWVIWTGITALGAFALAGIALNRNEPVSAAWLVTAAICVYLISYRFYGKFIAEKVLRLDDTRMTPAKAIMMASTTFLPTDTSSSVITSRPSRGPDHWSGRCSLHRWAICQELSGSS